MLPPYSHATGRLTARLDPLTLEFEWFMWIEVARHELDAFLADMGERSITVLRRTPRWIEYDVVLRDFDDALRFEKRGAYFR
jgi:hypothetical protein